MAQQVDLATVRQFGNMEFLAKQLVEGFITGLHKSPYHGFSVEFSEHRLDKINLQTPVKSTGSHIHTIMLNLQQLLDQPRPTGQTDVATVLHQIAQQIPKRSLVIIFSDMLSRQEDTTAIFEALQHLKHQNHEVLLFHVMDRKTEEDFTFSERPYLFVDVETGEELKLQPSQVRDNYKAAMETFKHSLELKCHQYKIDFIPVDINEPFDKVLYGYLVKRGKMKA